MLDLEFNNVFNLRFNLRNQELGFMCAMNVFNWKLGLFNLGGRSEIGWYHHVGCDLRNVYIASNLSWGSWIERIDSKKTRRRRRVSSIDYGRFRPFLVKSIVWMSWGGLILHICTIWRLLVAGIATSGEARGGGCKIAVWPLDFWRWWSLATQVSFLTFRPLKFPKLQIKPCSFQNLQFKPWIFFKVLKKWFLI